MSLLFDQNLSRRLPALLAAEFPGSEQVLLAGLLTHFWSTISQRVGSMASAQIW